MHAVMNARRRDYVAGLLVCALGLWAVVQGMHYEVGSLTDMGPGFFPTAVGVTMVMAGIGIAVAGRARVDAEQADSDVKPRKPEWRGWFCIALGIVLFIVVAKFLGLLPATFATVFVSALGDRDNSVKNALLLSAAVGVMCVVVFWWALKIQLPLFRWG